MPKAPVVGQESVKTTPPTTQHRPSPEVGKVFLADGRVLTEFRGTPEDELSPAQIEARDDFWGGRARSVGWTDVELAEAYAMQDPDDEAAERPRDLGQAARRGR